MARLTGFHDYLKHRADAIAQLAGGRSPRPASARPTCITAPTARCTACYYGPDE
jgi:hypothetical protein